MRMPLLFAPVLTVLIILYVDSAQATPGVYRNPIGMEFAKIEAGEFIMGTREIIVRRAP